MNYLIAALLMVASIALPLIWICAGLPYRRGPFFWD